MNSDLFNNFRVVEANFDFRFKPVATIEREFGKFEEGLKETFELDGTLTKVPDDAPPEIPRFILQSRNKRLLEVSLVNALYKSTPINLHAEEVLELYKKKCRIIMEYLKKTQLEMDHFRSIFVLRFPLKDINFPIANNALRQYISMKISSEKLLKIAAIAEYQIDNTFYQDVVETYEVRKKDFKLNLEREKNIQNKPVIMQFRKLSLPLVETGLSYKTITYEYIENDIEGCYNKVLELSLKKVNESESFLFDKEEA